MTTRKKIFLITSLLYILYTIFPLIADTVGIPTWLPSMVSFIIMLCLYPQAFNNRTCYWFMFYAVMLMVYHLFGRPLTIGIGSIPDGKKMLVEFAYILPSISIFSIITYLNDDDLLRKLFRWTIVILLISFWVAVPLMMRYNSLREALDVEHSEDLNIPGLPSYSLMHAYTLFLPVMCYAIRALEGKYRLLAYCGLICICFVIYDTFVTTSLLIMVFILIFTILYSKHHKYISWIIAFSLVIVIFILFEMGFLIPFVDWILPAFEGTAVEPKLLDFKESMILGHLTGSTIISRQNYHSISWYAFLRNPIFGSIKYGGHSSILDRLGGMGMFVGVPFLMIFISSIQRLLSFFKTKTAKAFFWIGVITGFVYLYNKGNWGCEDWISYLALMPIGLLVIERKCTHESLLKQSIE